MDKTTVYTFGLLSALSVIAYYVYFEGVPWYFLVTAILLIWGGFKLGKAVEPRHRDKYRHLNKILD